MSFELQLSTLCEIQQFRYALIDALAIALNYSDSSFFTAGSAAMSSKMLNRETDIIQRVPDLMRDDPHQSLIGGKLLSLEVGLFHPLEISHVM